MSLSPWLTMLFLKSRALPKRLACNRPLRNDPSEVRTLVQTVNGARYGVTVDNLATSAVLGVHKRDASTSNTPSVLCLRRGQCPAHTNGDCLTVVSERSRTYPKVSKSATTF